MLFNLTHNGINGQGIKPCLQLLWDLQLVWVHSFAGNTQPRHSPLCYDRRFKHKKYKFFWKGNDMLNNRSQIFGLTSNEASSERRFVQNL